MTSGLFDARDCAMVADALSGSDDVLDLVTNLTEVQQCCHHSQGVGILQKMQYDYCY